jgi:hypothetical protein
MGDMSMPTFYLNNLKNRQHAQLFGYGAFFDLDADGYQGNLITHMSEDRSIVTFNNGVCLNKGDAVQVYTYGIDKGPVANRSVVFKHYKFGLIKEDSGARVFIGESNAEECLSRQKAQEIYGGLFDKNGNFKQGSVIIDGKVLICRNMHR